LQIANKLPSAAPQEKDAFPIMHSQQQAKAGKGGCC
jgi:hypothetical protein